MPNPYRTIRRVGRIVGRVIGWTLYWLFMLVSLSIIVLATVSSRGVALLPFAGALVILLLVGLGAWGVSKLSAWLRRREAAWEPDND